MKNGHHRLAGDPAAQPAAEESAQDNGDSDQGNECIGTLGPEKKKGQVAEGTDAKPDGL